LGKILALDIHLLQEIALILFNTLVLFWIMTKQLYNPVSKFMENRTNSINSQINEANKLKAEALKIKEEYEERLNGIKKEADVILSEARKKAIETETTIIKRAKDEAQDMRKRLQTDLELFREQAKDNVRNEIINVSALMTKKIIEISIDENKQKQLMEESIQEIGDVKWLA